MQTLYGMDHVGKLADTGGLDDDAVRMIFLYDSFRAVPKSPTREQQIQPEFISRISIPASFRKPPSIPISPKFIFNQNDLLAFESVLQKFF